MNFREAKIEVWIGVLMVVMITGLFRLLGDSDDRGTIRGENVSYEMPRPKSELVGEFGLGDREIDRQYVNPFEKKKAEAAEAAKKAQAVADAAAAKAKAAAAGQAQGTFVPYRPTTSINVVGADHKHLTDDARVARDEQQQSPVYDQIANRAAAGAADEKKDDKLSAAQWRSLLNADPSKANMDKMVAAYLQRDLDDGGFYGIVEDLLENHQSATKEDLAFYGLGKVVTAKSFIFAAQQKVKPGNAVSATKYETYLNSYSTKSKMLFVAVQSKNAVVAKAAATVIVAVLKGTLPGDSAPVGNGNAQQSSIAVWTRYRVSLETLASSTDPSIHDAISEILQLLPTQNA